MNHFCLVLAFTTFGFTSAANCDALWLFKEENFQTNVFGHNTAHQNSTVCRCTTSSCDDFVVDPPQASGEYLKVRSSQKPLKSEEFPARFSQSTGQLASSLPSGIARTNYTVKDTKLQRIWGFGGALTDASAILIAEQPEQIQNEILSGYFSKENGNGYSMIRTNMGGCDFSVRQYTYADTPGDFELDSFQLAPEDTEYKIPLLNKIYEFAGGQDNIKLFAAPWTAPSWMKTNNFPSGDGSLIPDAEYYQTWANYFVKYINAYQDAGIKITQVSLQNEPNAGAPGTIFKWQETYWSPETANEFLSEYIIPTFEAAGLGDVTIQLFDGNRAELKQESWPLAELQGISAGTYNGNFQIAMHWYEDVLELFGRGRTQIEILEKIKQIHGDQVSMIGTEACMPLMSYPSGKLTYREASDDLGNWVHGDWYARDIIENMQRGYSGWTDWNIVLDMSGGPNWAGNRHDAPIILDTENNVFYKNPMFYAMGHFSKFLDDSYFVLEAGNTGRNPVANSEQFHFFAASNDVYEVYVFLNSGDYDISNTWLETSSGDFLDIQTPARSIETLVIKL